MRKVVSSPKPFPCSNAFQVSLITNECDCPVNADEMFNDNHNFFWLTARISLLSTCNERHAHELDNCLHIESWKKLHFRCVLTLSCLILTLYADNSLEWESFDACTANGQSRIIEWFSLCYLNVVIDHLMRDSNNPSAMLLNSQLVSNKFFDLLRSWPD